ncbi:hypothetical protein CFAM422_009328 [Trichoderma lentiforme]|uniref:Uncharacterized protein n=1 Tax=Trichoderma lentiforme TaxID=1567552 RepID=A0A9P4XA43_9HYPO|nr:hypothetical protein CFAM422_009328 [Trichoderma lentiforme]
MGVWEMRWRNFRIEAEWASLHKTQKWFDMSRYQMHITVARGGFSCGERDREIELASLFSFGGFTKRRKGGSRRDGLG